MATVYIRAIVVSALNCTVLNELPVYWCMNPITDQLLPWSCFCVTEESSLAFLCFLHTSFWSNLFPLIKNICWHIIHQGLEFNSMSLQCMYTQWIKQINEYRNLSSSVKDCVTLCCTVSRQPKKSFSFHNIQHIPPNVHKVQLEIMEKIQVGTRFWLILLIPGVLREN